MTNAPAPGARRPRSQRNMARFSRPCARHRHEDSPHILRNARPHAPGTFVTLTPKNRKTDHVHIARGDPAVCTHGHRTPGAQRRPGLSDRLCDPSLPCWAVFPATAECMAAKGPTDLIRRITTLAGHTAFAALELPAWLAAGFVALPFRAVRKFRLGSGRVDR